MAKSRVSLLMQINYPHIVWNNFPKFQENRASSFWDMRRSMCVTVGGNTTIVTIAKEGGHELDRYPFVKMKKSQEQYPY